jgi:hypothetical protein
MKMRAYIKLWGNQYRLSSIDWHSDQIAHVSFTDEEDVFHTIHKKTFSFEGDAETNRYTGELKHANFDEVIEWK